MDEKRRSSDASGARRARAHESKGRRSRVNTMITAVRGQARRAVRPTGLTGTNTEGDQRRPERSPEERVGIRRTAIRAAIAALLGQTATAGPLQVYAGGSSGGNRLVDGAFEHRPALGVVGVARREAPASLPQDIPEVDQGGEDHTDDEGDVTDSSPRFPPGDRRPIRRPRQGESSRGIRVLRGSRGSS